MSGAKPLLPVYAFILCTSTTLRFFPPDFHSSRIPICRVFGTNSRSQWPRGLRRRSSAARLLRSWVSHSPGAWMFVCCECCVLSGRGHCDGLITRPEESYRLWRVVVCDQETSKTRRLKPATGLWKIQPKWFVTPRKQTNLARTEHWPSRALVKECPSSCIPFRQLTFCNRSHQNIFCMTVPSMRH